MRVHKNIERKEWDKILQRPVLDSSKLERKVEQIIKLVRRKGDKALYKFTRKFDGVSLQELAVTKSEISDAEEQLKPALKDAIQQATHNIAAYHSTQVQYPRIIETMPGVSCWQKMVAIEKVGLYVPGGSAPLFSTVLMLGIPAKIMGCSQIVLCTPPGKDGKVHPAILFAANQAGIKDLYKVGGVQAIAAMAFGTETIPAVYKIFGPGNQYVTKAKQLVQQMGIGIDLPAGPSEVAVYADSEANPAFIVADLLSQAEHGGDSQVIFVTTSEALIKPVLEELKRQLHVLPRRAAAQQALEKSHAFLVNSEDEAMDLLNDYAPEHLILNCANADALAEKVVNAGSVFIGAYSPESVGDYASGPNHTLPTNGFAKMYSGLSVESFSKKISYQKLTETGLLNIGHHVIEMAEAEGLQAHAQAVNVRLKTIDL
jgi:histidinol dehydrogenase